MSTKSKLVIALSAILVTAFLTTSLINYMMASNAIRDELLNSSLPLTGKNIYSEIHSAMMEPILVSSAMGNDAFLKDWIQDGEIDLGAIKTFLKATKEEYGFLTAFFVSNVTDIYYYQDGINKEISARDPHDVWFYSFARSGKKYRLEVDTNELEGQELTIFVNFRVEDSDGHLLGVTGVGVSIDQATEMLRKAQDEHQREIYLVDQDGLVQVHWDKKKIERFHITKAAGIKDVADKILAEKDKVISLEYDKGDDHYLLSSRYIPELRWHLIVQQNEASAMVPAQGNLFRTIGIGFGSSILIIILCIITINHFQGRLERLALTDPLTGAANRRALEDHFEQSAYKCDRYNSEFSAIIMDLDEFKDINDSHGHVTGDQVLKFVADTAKATIRPSDTLARWGGDEFIILLDGDMDNARALAARLKAAISDTSFDFTISFSHGLSQYEEGDDIDSLTQRADQLLYEAKSRRREAEGQ